MNIWLIVILVIHVVAALVIIGLVLIQHGKGADMGAAFGGGASGSVFGATGSANFLSRTTAVFAAIFFATSLSLTYLATHRPSSMGGVMDSVKVKSATHTKAAKQPSVAKTAPSGAKSPAAKSETEKSKADEVPK